MTRRTLLAAALGLALGITGQARADILVGSTYTVSGTNFPTDFGPETVTLDLSTKAINGGQLTLTETLFSAPGGGQWIEFNFQTVGGGPLASNPNGFFQVGDINGIQLTGPESNTDAFFDFSVNGTPVSGLQSFAGAFARPNPIDSSAPDVLGFVGFTPSAPESAVNGAFFFATPFAAVLSDWGADPSAVNGAQIFLQVTPVPEPSSLALSLLGVTGLAMARRRRKAKGR